MDVILVKIFAAALTFSQIATAPPELKTRFDPATDQPEVVRLLRAGCEHVRKSFDVEAINLDDLIATAMEDRDAVGSGQAVFRGINLSDMFVAYRQFCKKEDVANSPVDLAEVITAYNRTLAELPDHTRLEGMTLPGTSLVLDRKGNTLGEVFAQEQHRVSIPLSDIPRHVQNAFISAEDKRFYEHNGIDVRSVIRAFMGNLVQSGRPQGGSTITQQVVKNLLVGEELTYERKMQEMVLAYRVEHTLTKPQILELYLNTIFLGRGAWGVEMAARTYFAKPASSLTIGEGALLAAMAKGPNFFSPDRRPDRAKERIQYVLGRMQEDGVIRAEEAKNAAGLPKLAPYEGSLRLAGSYFTDQVGREIKAEAELGRFRNGSYTVRSTLDPDLQRAAETALQEGLARYEQDAGRIDFKGPETNLATAIERLAGATPDPSAKPAWQQALESVRSTLPDVHWDLAVVLQKEDRGGRKASGAATRVGLADGRMLPLSGQSSILRNLKLYDVVFVRVSDRKGREGQAALRVRPTVQGAAVVLENKTGRVLAMVGGFSYALSQINRATQAQRQPGSTLKPLTYLAALQSGMRPDSMVPDEEITLPPINGSKREQDYWSPRNYDGSSHGMIPMRQALANSRNLATVNLLDGRIEAKPQKSLEKICTLARELQIYKDCMPYYPFVLGAQPVRPIDLAAFYTAISNEGARPAPYTIETIQRNGEVLYQHRASISSPPSADAGSFYELKTMLQGVIERGTARAISRLAPYVAGKTGTTDDETDTWFSGFSNQVTVTVWVGYDNGDGKRRTLGGGETGASVALPIFEPIIEASWSDHGPRTQLSPPSAAARRLIALAEQKGRRGYGRDEDDDRPRRDRVRGRRDRDDDEDVRGSRRQEASRARARSVARDPRRSDDRDSRAQWGQWRENFQERRGNSYNPYGYGPSRWWLEMR
jgi:1A family penicillin-binding protein